MGNSDYLLMKWLLLLRRVCSETYINNLYIIFVPIFIITYLMYKTKNVNKNNSQNYWFFLCPSKNFDIYIFVIRNNYRYLLLNIFFVYINIFTIYKDIDIYRKHPNFLCYCILLYKYNIHNNMKLLSQFLDILPTARFHIYQTACVWNVHFTLNNKHC